MAIKKQSNKKHNKQGLTITAVVASLVAGAYFLSDNKQVKKNKKIVKGWMLKAKGEVLDKMEKVQDLKKSDYEKIINSVSDKYKKLKSVNSKEIQDLTRDLKKQWVHISKDMIKNSPAKTPAKKCKRTKVAKVKAKKK